MIFNFFYGEFSRLLDMLIVLLIKTPFFKMSKFLSHDLTKQYVYYNVHIIIFSKINLYSKYHRLL